MFSVLVAAAEPPFVIEAFYSGFPMFYREISTADLCDAFYFAAFLGGFQGVVDGVHFDLGVGGRGRFKRGVALGGFGARVAA